MSQLTVKTTCKGDIRKIRVAGINFNWLKKNIIKTYALENVNFRLFYVDEEQDKITIGNLNDLNLALETVPEGKMLKIHIKILKKSPECGEEGKQSDLMPLLKLEQPKKEGEKVVPLMKLQKPKPQPKENKKGEKKPEGEVLLPLMKLQKPKPQPKENKKEDEVLPLMKLQKPKPQPKENKKEEKKIEGEVLLPLMKLQKPKPQPKENKKEEKKPEGEKLLPLMKLQKPKPQPKENKKEEKKTEGEVLLPLMKLQKPKPQPKEDKSTTEKETSQTEKIPIIFGNLSDVETPRPEEFDYNSSLNDLVMMGFPDNSHLRNLLVENKGNLEATISQLLN